MTDALPYAHGGPPASGLLRATAADFAVDEVLGFEPSGSGEHAFVRIEKTGANTEWVARQLAAALGVAPLAVGFAGMKDRHAVTRQTFSIALPGRPDPDWATISIPGVRLLAAARHDRKLKRGAHRGNRFRIVLRDVEGDRGEVDARVACIAALGVPNYFGEQRFGRDGQNLAHAAALFAGRRMARSQRGIVLSAARSAIFNTGLAARVAAGNWNRGLNGEVWMLAGTHSIFGPVPVDDEIERRAAALDIHPTGVLWGKGELRSAGAARVLELAAMDSHRALADGLVREGLAQERRALRLVAEGLRHEWLADGALALELTLPSGSFATTVLREICRWREPNGSFGAVETGLGLPA